MGAAGERAAWGQAGALLGASDIGGGTGSKGWKGVGQFPKGQDLVAPFVPDQVASQNLDKLHSGG